MPKIINCLWFDTEAEDAAKLYVSLFPNSRIGETARYPEGLPGDRAGRVMTVEFELDGTAFVGLNGGPLFKFNEAVSFQIFVKDQAELDHYWDGLTAHGGEESQCGWLKDRFGVSWQVVPAGMGRWMKNPQTGQKVAGAFMQMKKLDIAVLQAAAAG
jgi:predicted 3-demethylubiquinone-9 3-methyltransferase (glyoxalase superfamily)